MYDSRSRKRIKKITPDLDINVATSPVIPRCVGKVSYESEREAKNPDRPFGMKMRPYRCPYCQKWHNTTKPPKSTVHRSRA